MIGNMITEALRSQFDVRDVEIVGDTSRVAETWNCKRCTKELYFSRYHPHPNAAMQPYYMDRAAELRDHLMFDCTGGSAR